MHFLSIFLLSMGCLQDEKGDQLEGEFLVDEDLDGFIAAEDCDDNNININPDATEECDEIDNNCNGLIDEDVTVEFYGDSDGDGFGNIQLSVSACEAPDGYTFDNTDCDDTNLSIYPEAEEICDGMDNDCNTEVDEGLMSDFFLDMDTDGYGGEITTEACMLALGLSLISGDCNDEDGTIHPDSIEICDEIDNNCNGDIDEAVLDTWYPDVDGDGHGNDNGSITACVQPDGYVAQGGDCDDLEIYANPVMIELCDGIDNDCDNNADEAGSFGENTYYLDSDLDGYGDHNSSIKSCTQPTDYVANDLDCDDEEATTFPNGTEICDGVDNNCDGNIDEHGAIDADFWFQDADGDGYGNIYNIQWSCNNPTGYVENHDDCDDDNTDISPLAQEECDGIDNDCDALIDDSDDVFIGGSTYGVDADGDGYGSQLVTVLACSAPLNFVEDVTDCNDGLADVFPGALETCDGIDNDCDVDIDDDDADVDHTTGSVFYEDGDGDGYGDHNSQIESCVQPIGYVENHDDCDDGNTDISPLGQEICDGLDNDCNGDFDEDDEFITGTLYWYYDGDSDGYGDASTSVFSCESPIDYVSDATDCDDGEPTINPIAEEICNGIDDDCNGDTDSDATDIVTWYEDVDGDQYGNNNVVLFDCNQPTDFSLLGDDCNDGNIDINPGATEICDAEDNNCDGLTDPSADVYGMGESCPGVDCLDILNTLGTSAVDGLYWMSSNGSDSFEVVCDMTTDGGGWTQVIVALSGEVNDTDPPDFSYNSSVWTDGYGQAGDTTHISETWFNSPAFSELLYYEDSDGYQQALSITGNLSEYSDSSNTVHLNVNASCSFGPCGGRLFRTWTNAICNTGNGSTDWGAGLGPIRSCQHTYGTLYYEFSSTGFSEIKLLIR